MKRLISKYSDQIKKLKEKRLDFIIFVKRLERERALNKISAYSHQTLILNASNGLSPKQFVADIDNQIAHLEDLQNRKYKIQNAAIIGIAATIILMFAGFLFFNPTLTGFVTNQNFQSYSIKVDNEFLSGNTTYDLVFNENITSLVANGNYSGNFSIFLIKTNDDGSISKYLIYKSGLEDSNTNVKTDNALTGLVLAPVRRSSQIQTSTKTSTTSKKTSTSKIKLPKIITINESNSTDANQTNITTSNESIIINETITLSDTNSTILNETNNTIINISNQTNTTTSNETIIDLPNDSQIQTPNETKTEINEVINESVELINEPVEENNTYTIFSNACIDTCDFNFNTENSKIQIEVYDGYVYIKDFVYTKITVNIPPLQIKNFSDITIGPNSNSYSIDLSDYFNDTDKIIYDIKDISPLEYTIKKNILTIKNPGIFDGTVDAFIYATDSKDMTISNSFKIIVHSNFSNETILNDTTTVFEFKDVYEAFKNSKILIDDEILRKLQKNESPRIIIKYRTKDFSLDKYLKEYYKNISKNNISDNKTLNKTKGAKKQSIVNGQVIGPDANQDSLKFEKNSEEFDSAQVSINDLSILENIPEIEAVYIDQPASLLFADSKNIIEYDRGIGYFYNLTGIILNGSSSKICILDTGVNSSLISYSNGWDFVNNDSDPIDDNGHGTSVAYIISNMASGADLIIVKVMNSAGFGYESDVLSGLQYCQDQNATIISLSIGSGSYSGYCNDNPVAQKVNELNNASILVIAGTGNDGSSLIKSPACAEGALAVSSSTKNDSIASFSSFNDATLLVAPGESISTINHRGDSIIRSGASMSVPFISGVTGLLIDKNIHESLVFDSNDLKDVIIHTGVLINNSQRLFSRVDVFNALSLNYTNNLTAGNVSFVAYDNQTVFELLALSNLTAWNMLGIPSNPYNSSLVEATSTAYTNISASDNTRWLTGLATNDGEWDTQVFIINTTGNRSRTAFLNFSWEGYGESQSGYYTNISFYNWTANKWFQITFWQSSGADETKNATLNYGVPDFINSTTNRVAVMVTTRKYVGVSQTCGNGIREGTEVCDSDMDVICACDFNYIYSGYVEDGATCNGKGACKNDCTACITAAQCNDLCSPYIYAAKDNVFTKLADFIPFANTSEKKYTSYTDVTGTTISENALKLKITEEINEVAYIDKYHVLIFEYPKDAQLDFSIWFSKNFEGTTEYNYKQKNSDTINSIIPYYVHAIEKTSEEYDALTCASDEQYLTMNKGFEKEISFNINDAQNGIDRKIFFVAEGYFIQSPQTRLKTGNSKPVNNSQVKIEVINNVESQADKPVHKSLYTDVLNLTYSNDTTTPVVQLLSIANLTNLVATNNLSINLTCNMTDNIAIGNITLVIWNSSNNVIYTNVTVLTTGAVSATQKFNFTITRGDTYKWNCLGNDSSGNSAWANNGNFTFLTIPVVTFQGQSPANNTIINISYEEFNISVTEAFPLANLTWTFNQTNYTAYNMSIVLMYNLNNFSALGENSSRFVDVSLYEQNATCTNSSLCPTFTNSGKYNGAYYFDGLNDFINITTTNNLPNGTSSKTMCAWAMTNITSGTWAWIFAYGTASTGQAMALGRNGASLIGTGYGSDLTVTSFWNAGVWNHICLTYDGATATLYANGANLTNATASWSLVKSKAYIGRQVNDIEYWNGTIDEVRLWNRSLTPAEIQKEYKTNLNKNSNHNWTYYINQTNISGGSYRYSATATDIYGDTNQSAEYTLFVWPELLFRNPTPVNATSTNNASVIINLTMNESLLDNFAFNWNGTNYTLYNNSLVLMMNFDNNSYIGENDNLTIDVSKYGNNGTCIDVNCSNIVTNGVYGNARMFNGSDFITVNWSNSLNFSKGMSIEYWINANQSGTGSQGILGMTGQTVGAHTGKTFRSYIISNNIWFDAAVDAGPTSVQASTLGSAIQDNTWYHIVGTFDGTTAYIYLNGVQKGSSPLVGNMSVNSSWNFTIGKTFGFTRGFNGTLDEIKLFNRALTPSEITEEYMTSLRKLNASHWWLYVNQSNLTSGNYTYYATANNTNGIRGTTETRILIVDSTAPTITLNTPGSPYFNKSTGITLSCNISDNIQVYNLTLYVWNASNSAIFTNTTLLGGASNSTSWTNTMPYEGTFNWSCLGYDAAGNSAWASSNYTFLIDTTSPSLTINSPVINSYSNNKTITINITATDTNMNYTNISIYDTSWVLVSTTTNTTNGTYTLTLTVTNDGNYTVNATTYDNGTNSVTKNTTSINIDATIPVVTFQGQTDANNSYIPRTYSFVNVTQNDVNNGTYFIDWNYSLAGWYKFNNEPSENLTYFKDNSTYQRNATCSGTGCPIVNASGGRFGSGLIFDGSNDVVNTTYDFPDEFNATIQVWVKPAVTMGNVSGNNVSTIFSLKDITYINSSLFLQVRDQYEDIVFYLMNNSCNSFACGMNADGNTAINLTAGRWYLLTVVFDTSTSNAKIYVNDTLYVEATAFSSYPNTNLSAALTLGFTSSSFNGSMDDLKIFSRALSWQEINASFSVSKFLYNNFTNLVSNGTYQFAAFSQDLAGNINSTGYRTTIVDTVYPSIAFQGSTSTNNSYVSRNWTYINISLTESNLNKSLLNWNGSNFTYFDDNLVLMMNFNNVSSLGDSSTKFVDVSNYQNNGTCSGACPEYNTSGKYGTALVFNGTNTYMNITNSPSLENITESSYTWSLWYYPLTTPPNTVNNNIHYLICKQGFHTDLEYTNSTTFTFAVWNSSDSGFGAASVVTHSPNNWYFIVGKVNTTNSKVDLYVNGVLEATNTYAGTLRDYGTNPVRIGICGNPGAAFSGPANGTIDEVRIYNRALPAAEIQQLYYSNFNKLSTGAWQFVSNESNMTGTYSYYGYAIDDAGNSNQTETRIITADMINPVVVINSPANGTFRNNKTMLINLTVTEANINLTNISIYNTTGWGLINTTTSTSTGTFTISLETPGDGNYSINATAYDLAGNTAKVINGWIIIDTTNSTLTINSPATNTYRNNRTIPINITSTDTFMNYTNISVYDTTWTLINTTTSTTNGTYIVSLGTAADGNYTINVTTYDLSANSVKATVSGINIDTANPAIIINSPSNYTYRNNKTLIINLTATDNNYNLTNISIYNTTWGLINTTTSTQNGTFTITLGIPSEGNYSINATTYDYATNSALATGNNIIIDTTAPTISYQGQTPTNNSFIPGYAFVNISQNDLYNGSYFIDWNYSLVAWFRLNNEAGENNSFFKDYSTYQNNATCSGTACPGFNQTGKFGGAYKFDGNLNWLNITNASSLAFSNGTIEAWIKTSGAGSSFRGIVVKQNAYGMFLNANEFGIYDWNASLWKGTGILLNDSTWHHVAVTIQDRVTNGTKIYIDGALKNITSYNISTQNIAFTISGGSNPPVSQYFNGSIDEVKIFNRVLSAVEINASYNSTLLLYNNFTSLTNSGSYNFIAYSQDLAGNVNNTITRTVIVDSTSPSITINSPATNTYRNNRTILINITATDNTFNYTNISIYNTTWGLINTTTNTTNGTYTLTLGVPADGNYTINATAYDNATNTATASTSGIVIDTVNPTITINSPATNANLTSRDVIINITVSDTNFNYTNITIYNTTWVIINATTDATSGTYTVNLSVPLDGIYNINATAYDYATNNNKASSTNVNVSTAVICAVLSTPNTEYNITFNLTKNGGTCFNVTAQNITIDCQGYAITGNNSTSAYGVYSNQFNTTVKNCIINAFQHDVWFNGANNGTIFNVNATTTHNSGYAIYSKTDNYTTIVNSNANSTRAIGIYLSSNANYNTILNSTGTSNADGGLFIDSSSNNTVINSSGRSISGIGFHLQSSSNNSCTKISGISSSNYGIRFYSSSNNTLTNVTSVSNSASGLYILSSSSNNTLTNVNATSVSSSAIQVSSPNNIFSNINATSNNSYAALLINSNNNIFNNVYATSDSNKGIYILVSTNNTLTTVNTTSQSSNGMYIYGSSNNTLSSIIANSNSGASLVLESSSNNSLSSITSTSSTGYGIYFLSSSNNTLANSIAQSSTQPAIIMQTNSNHNILNNINTTTGSHYSLYAQSCSHNFFNNIKSISTSQASFYMSSVNDSSLTNINSTANGGNGISLVSSSNNTITDSTTSGSIYGLFLSNANNNSILNVSSQSTLSTGLGYYMSQSGNNTITNSSFIGDTDMSFSTNSINFCSNNFTGVTGTAGKSIYYFNSTFSLSDADISTVIFCNANYSTVTNITTTHGLVMSYFSNYNNLSRINTSSNNYYGIYVYYSNNNLLSNINSNTTSGIGIYISYSDNNNISNINTSSINSYGLSLDTSSDNNIFSRVNITSTSSTGGLIAYSFNNTFANSTFSSNASFAADLLDITNSTFYNNTFFSTGGASTLLYVTGASSGNKFYWNNFTTTTGYYVDESGINPTQCDQQQPNADPNSCGYSDGYWIVDSNWISGTAGNTTSSPVIDNDTSTSDDNTGSNATLDIYYHIPANAVDAYWELYAGGGLYDIPQIPLSCINSSAPSYPYVHLQILSDGINGFVDFFCIDENGAQDLYQIWDYGSLAYEEGMLWYILPNPPPNFYNSTEGNIWANVMNGSVVLSGNSFSSAFPSLLIGTGGSGHPYNYSTSSGKVSQNVIDYRPLFFDAINPQIAFTTNTDLNNSYVNRNWIFVNITFSDTNLVNGTIRLYNSSGSLLYSNASISSPYKVNYTGLSAAVFYFNATAYDSIGNSNTTETRIVTIDTTAPVVHLISPPDLNATTNNWTILNCSITDNIKISNLTVYVWNSTNSIISSSTTSLGGTSNYTTWNVSFAYTDSYKWNCLGNDSAGNYAWSSEGNYTIGYTSVPSNVSLVSPINGNITVHQRRPNLDWNASNSANYYEISITTNNCGAVPLGNTTDTNFTPSQDLCTKTDDGATNTYYNWTVRACNTYFCSPWSEVWNFTIEPYVVITLVNSTVNFGNLALSVADDTTDGNPGPFVLQNDGNVNANMINITTNQSLWASSVGALGTQYFQAKARNSTQNNTFNNSGSQMDWINISMTNRSIISQLQYNTSFNQAFVDLRVQVPFDEPPGAKSTYLLFVWAQYP